MGEPNPVPSSKRGVDGAEGSAKGGTDGGAGGLKVSISLLSADMFDLKDELARINRSSVDYIHLDVMDGHFVPNLTFGYELIAELKKRTGKVLDTHLMISNPEKYLAKYVASGADILGIHYEIKSDVTTLLQEIRKLGAKPCLVFNPGSSLSEVERFFPYVDQILLMSVNPGFAGQKFIEDTLMRGREVAAKIKKASYEIDLQIDGGVSDENVKAIRASGFNVVVSGSYLFRGESLEENIGKLRRA